MDPGPARQRLSWPSAGKTLIRLVRQVVLALPLASVPHQEEERVRRQVCGGLFLLTLRRLDCDSIVTLKHVCMQITAEYLRGLFSSAVAILDKC